MRASHWARVLAAVATVGLVSAGAGEGTSCAADGGDGLKANSMLQSAQASRKRTRALGEEGVRPCTGSRTSRCCGDGVCDGPETSANCADDCGGAAPAPAAPAPLPVPPTAPQPNPPPAVSPPARACTNTLTARCCGDGVCDGPETTANCAADCDGTAPAPPPPAPQPAPQPMPPAPAPQPDPAPAPQPSPPPPITPPARACTDQLTSRCCGDGLCDGPESVSNCPMDCSGGGDGGEPGEPGTPAPAPGPGPPAGTCTIVPAEKPTVPTLCTAQNQGCCDCAGRNVDTYVFWTEGGSAQRCLHTSNLPSSPPGAPMPVVLHMDGYSGGRANMRTDMVTAAQYYGFAVFSITSNLKDGAGGFGLQFGNNGVANDDNPTPCSSSDSRDIEFLQKVFDFIADRPTLLDASKVYTEGFSQNSMFAIYTAVCFADKVAGAWQGGSGQSRTGSNPVAPGYQGQCSFDSYATNARDCCNQDFCSECQYWPLWPKTCKSKLVDCIVSYTDDSIACGSDWYMYEAMAQEGNDARLLSFPVPSGETFAGHRDPKNKWAWFAGCLGIAPACSSSCAASFDACIDGASDAKDYDKFATCEGQLKAGSLSSCTVGCAPTLGMLQRSESPVVTLSEGKFGSDASLPPASGSAPKPNCKVPFGPFTTGPGPKPKCTPPSSYAAPAIDPKDTC